MKIYAGMLFEQHIARCLTWRNSTWNRQINVQKVNLNMKLLVVPMVQR